MRTLLDNDDWFITVGSLGGITVTLKHRRMRVKATRAERLHLLETFKELQVRGIPIEPGNESVESVLDEFSEALFSRGRARWRAYFSQSPIEIADESLDSQT